MTPPLYFMLLKILVETTNEHEYTLIICTRLRDIEACKALAAEIAGINSRYSFLMP